MDGKRKGFLVALVIGLIAAPALALAASGLLGGQAKADEAATTTAAAVAPVTAAPATAPTTSAADLEAACTTEGENLVAREAAGTLSDLQQAALDALRPICEAEGFSLEAGPGAGIGASVAAAPVPATTTTITTAPAGQFDDGDDEAEYEDDGEHEDHEDESDDHEDDD